MKKIRRIYPYGPAVGEYTSKGTVAETFARAFASSSTNRTQELTHFEILAPHSLTGLTFSL
jgi:hypothetical protein